MLIARASGILTFMTNVLTSITSFLFFILLYLTEAFQKKRIEDRMDEKQASLNKNFQTASVQSGNMSLALCENNFENINPNLGSLIIFDLETSGLSCEYAEILQISAVYKGKEFNAYIQPLLPISYNATMVNKLSLVNKVLCYDKNPVVTTSLLNGLVDFLKWLESIPPPRFLLGHNIKNFDCSFLLKALLQYDLFSEFSQLVLGFIDTFPLFRELCPKTEVENYRQSTLVGHYLNVSYIEHNAIEDVGALQKLLSYFQCSNELLRKHFISTHSLYELFQKRNSYKVILSSYHNMIKNKTISQNMATRFAKSKISYKDLVYSYKNGGKEALTKCLYKYKNRKVVGTKSPKIIEQIYNYLEENTKP